jgi:hypothetical protein
MGEESNWSAINAPLLIRPDLTRPITMASTLRCKAQMAVFENFAFFSRFRQHRTDETCFHARRLGNRFRASASKRRNVKPIILDRLANRSLEHALRHRHIGRMIRFPPDDELECSSRLGYRQDPANRGSLPGLTADRDDSSRNGRLLQDVERSLRRLLLSGREASGVHALLRATSGERHRTRRQDACSSNLRASEPQDPLRCRDGPPPSRRQR